MIDPAAPATSPFYRGERLPVTERYAEPDLAWDEVDYAISIPLTHHGQRRLPALSFRIRCAAAPRCLVSSPSLYPNIAF